jgi:hypothetical protein
MVQAINNPMLKQVPGGRGQEKEPSEALVMREGCDHDQGDEDKGGVDRQRVDTVFRADAREQAFQRGDQGRHPVVSNQSISPSIEILFYGNTIR